MALFWMMIGFMAFILFFIVKNKGSPISNWPIVGTSPEIVLNLHRLHDKLTEILGPSRCTFLYRGPWFSGTDMLITVDPANIHHIMTQNFSNFPKGSKFRQIFEVMGDGIFNADHESWKTQRKMARSIMTHEGFVRLTKSTNLHKVAYGLLPILDHLSARGTPVDLQDLLQRLTFDVTSILISGYDPRSLSVELPDVPYMKAMDEVEQAFIYRHLIPQTVWKLMRWLDVGSEKKLAKGWQDLDRILHESILKKPQQKVMHNDDNDDDDDDDDDRFDMLSSFARMGMRDHKFLRDVVVNFMTAGRDTTSSALSWFFWLISRNPNAKNNILKELETVDFDFNHPELTKLPYLHGSLCETLRLYPSVPFQHKSPLEPDVLPTGHRVDSKSTVVFSLYAMGRMRSIWGDDCLEFKPERWISERGGARHEPAYKFLAFNAGPRTCIGREVAMGQMKMVVASIIGNYDVEILNGQNVVPSLSVILHMRNGLMVKVTKRRS